MPRPTIADVARLAGVSRQTVSNVLNNPEVVRAETRTRVATAVAELGYRPHEAARSFGCGRARRSRSGSTRCAAASPAPSSTTSCALADRAGERRMRITLFAAADPRRAEIEEYARLRDAAAADAVIVTLDAPRRPAHRVARARASPSSPSAARLGVPRRPERRWVDVDGHAGVAQATRHLARRPAADRLPRLARGLEHRRRPPRFWEAVLREDSGADDAELAALRVETESRSRTPACVEGLLRRGGGLDALVCADDSLALGAMMAVREAGRPDSRSSGSTTRPGGFGLSSVDQRLGEVAAAALELLMGPSGRRVLPFPWRTAVPPARHPEACRAPVESPGAEDAGGTASGDDTTSVRTRHEQEDHDHARRRRHRGPRALRAARTGGGDSNGGGDGGGSDAKLTILIGSSGDAETKAVQAAADAWPPDNGATVEVVAASDSPRSSSTISGGEPPDLFYMSWDRSRTTRRTATWTPTPTRCRTQGSSYPSLKEMFTYDGTFTCAPKDFSTLGLIINTDLWAAAGLTDADIPTTGRSRGGRHDPHHRRRRRPVGLPGVRPARRLHEPGGRAARRRGHGDGQRENVAGSSSCRGSTPRASCAGRRTSTPAGAARRSARPGGDGHRGPWIKGIAGDFPTPTTRRTSCRHSRQVHLHLLQLLGHPGDRRHPRPRGLAWSS